MQEMRRQGSDPWVGKISRRRKREPTPVFSPAKFHGQRSLAGYIVQGVTESELNTHAHRLGTSYLKRVVFKICPKNIRV